MNTTTASTFFAEVSLQNVAMKPGFVAGWGFSQSLVADVDPTDGASISERIGLNHQILLAFRVVTARTVQPGRVAVEVVAAIHDLRPLVLTLQPGLRLGKPLLERHIL